MASLLKVDTLTGVTTAGSISVTGEGNSTTTNLQQGLAKAWIDVPGGAASINDSFGISSLDDDSTGAFGIHVINNFANAYHVPKGSTNNGSSVVLCNYIVDSRTTSSWESSTIYVSSTANRTFIDRNAHISTHGDLA